MWANRMYLRLELLASPMSYKLIHGPAYCMLSSSVHGDVVGLGNYPTTAIPSVVIDCCRLLTGVWFQGGSDSTLHRDSPTKPTMLVTCTS